MRSQIARGWQIQRNNIRALLLRDLMMRYGRDNIGFAWTVLEPMILTCGVLVIWSLIRPSYEHGIRLIGLVFTGYMPLTLWRHLTITPVALYRLSAGTLYHRSVSLLDILLSRMLLEFIGTTTAFFIVYLTLIAAGFVEPIYDYGLVVVGWLMMGWLAFGVGAVTAVLTELYEWMDKFIGPIQYLQLPLSGTFFLVDWLPESAQRLIWYNPTVHCYEVFRAGFFGPSIVTHYSLWYLGLWAFVLSLAGIWGSASIRDHVRLN